MAASLEGGFALLALLRIPTDPTNAFLLGLSRSRFLMAVFLLAVTILFIWLSVVLWRKSDWEVCWLDPQRFPKFFTHLHWLSAFVAFGIAVALFLLRHYNPENFLPLFERAKPLGVYLLVLFLQLSFWLLFLRLGWDINAGKRAGKILRPAGIAFAALLAVFAFIAMTRIGLTPDSAYWAEPGVALQGWQFVLALVLGVFAFLLTWHIPLQNKKTDWLLALLIWGVAVAVWWSVPMEVLRNSFYAPYAYPLDTSFPYSDAGFYDYLSQGLLLGSGFFTRIPPRPLYVILLAGLHALFGLDYEKVLFAQTLLIALLPVTFYFIGRKIHSRAAGLLIAFFAIFREWTNLLISSQTRVSNSRMTLTDLPTALVLTLAALAVVYWLKKAGRRADQPLIAGGIFGMLLLLRTQSMLLLPVVILLACLVYFPRWKEWLLVSTIFVFGVLLSASPWLIRNARLTGKITFDDPSQLAVLSSQYKLTDNLTPQGFDYENESLSNSLLDFALQHPAFVARFISTHFFAGEINALLALPLIEPFNGFQQPVNIYWTSWDGSLSLQNQMLLIIYLAIIALGIGAAWRRFRWVGLTPLLFNLGYALSNGVARFSGWRYDLPADWIAYFYFGVGFIEIIYLLASLFGSQEEKPFPFAKKPRNLTFLASLLFLLIGSLPLIIESSIPAHFPVQTDEELLAQISPHNPEIGNFASQEDAVIFVGQLIYPRFYPRGGGIASAHPWAIYAARDYSRVGFLLLNQRRVDVVFPIKNITNQFANGEDVIVLGCQREDYLEGRFIYWLNSEETLLSDRAFTPCTE